jgi:hypothetical protein
MAERPEQLFTGYWRYLAVRAACKLDLFEHIAAGVRTVPGLCAAISCDQRSLDSLVGALVHEEYLLHSEEGLRLSLEAQRLCAGHPNSVKHACLLWGAEHMDAWQHLDESIRSGQPVFTKLFGDTFFRYLDGHPERAVEYHRAMFEYARQDYAGIGEVLDLSAHRSVMDVGGGNGALVGCLRAGHPGVSFRIFDIQDHRTDHSRDILFIQGDFFNAVPEGSDALLLSRVIHDWDDAQALQILRNCHSALPREGALFLIENDLSMLADGGHLLSLNMLATCGSRERSVQEYQQLLEGSGFRVQGLVHHGNQAIIKTVRA